jgi:tetratricopeptide (TPR) repeat protein
MADNLMHESKLNEAVVLYEKAIETYPELTEATGNLAIAYARLGNTARAKKIILSMIDQIPGRAYVGYLNLGDIYREKEDYKQALEYYRQAVEGNPFPHDANKLIAFCLKQEGSLTEALKYYGKSLQFYSDFASLYSGSLQRDKFRFRNTPENLTKIEKLMKDDDHRKSLEPFDEEAFLFAASSNPEVAKIYNEMGTIYYELGKKELAEKAFRNALSVNPGYNNARRNLNMISRD